MNTSMINLEQNDTLITQYCTILYFGIVFKYYPFLTSIVYKLGNKQFRISVLN